MSWSGLTLFGDAATRTFFDLARLHRMTQWWHWMVLVVACLAIVIYVSWLYRRDSLELPRGIRWVLLLLRIVAFVGLLIFFMNLEKRTERLLTRPSRLVMLIDTSQSMSLADSVNGSSVEERRISQVADWLKNKSASLDELRKKHDVAVYRFDETNAPVSIATFPKVKGNDKQVDNTAEATDKLNLAIRQSKTLYFCSFVFLGIALLALIMQFVLGSFLRGAEGESWSLFIATVGLIVGIVFYAVCNVRNPNVSPPIAFGWQPPEAIQPTADRAATDVEVVEPEVDWEHVLVAQGAETRLGEVLRSVVQQEQGGPLSGIVVLTDGANNAGIDESAAADLARQMEIKIYPVGMGSDQRSRNVRLVDVEVPPRVYPGDNFTVKAYIQAAGLSNETCTVRLVSRDDSVKNGDAENSSTEDKRDFDEGDPIALNFAGDEIKTVEFQAVPDAVGRRIYTVQVDPITKESNLQDNKMSSKVEIIERRNRVLLFAGGPNREYRFLRNQLFRDKETEVDVLLQTAPPNAAQESNNLLLDFPATPADMFEYDCVVAFDPDWTKLDSEHIQLLERWVAEKAGGLLLVAGPVHGTKWTRSRRGDSKLTPILNLYPVTFFRRLASTIQLGRTASETPWPLKFTEDGLKADFLKLEDPAASEKESAESVWNDFDGVYGYFSVKNAKPGATVYSYFSDPQTIVDDRLPIYMAGQFYGAGRVFFIGSAEMWRLNELDPSYFERFYTKLIRFVSQGRLLRDSSRGVLIVDKERCARGEHVAVRAALSDAQFQPLKDAEVKATLVGPQGNTRDLVLRRVKNASRDGLYAGQFTALEEGAYRIDLLIPGSQNEMLSRDVRVSVPLREIEKPQRNDAVLSHLATATEGTYYVGLKSVQGTDASDSLFDRLKSMDQEIYLPGTSDDEFQQRLMTWLLGIICGALCLEWLIRRLCKLA